MPATVTHPAGVALRTVVHRTRRTATPLQSLKHLLIVFAVPLLLVALILALVSTFIAPVLKLLSLPFIILTLGLFVFIVNALMLQLTSWLANQFNLAFHVQNFFWDAVFGALIITFVSMLLGFLKTDD